MIHEKYSFKRVMLLNKTLSFCRDSYILQHIFLYVDIIFLIIFYLKYKKIYTVELEED